MKCWRPKKKMQFWKFSAEYGNFDIDEIRQHDVTFSCCSTYCQTPTNYSWYQYKNISVFFHPNLPSNEGISNELFKMTEGGDSVTETEYFSRAKKKQATCESKG